MTQRLAELADTAFKLAVEAGEAIMTFYGQTDKLQTQYKSDNSPLTEADKAAHRIIHDGLSNLTLEGEEPIPVLSEEGRQIPFIERQAWQRYWCVDPLDGTKEFLVHNDEFTVNIALIENQHPIVGIIYVPAQKVGYVAWREGGTYRRSLNGGSEKLAASVPSAKPLRVLVSRHYNLEVLQPWLSLLGEVTLVHQGSALKFCALAAGEADIFLRLSPTSEWDNAAGHCLLEEAGGKVFTLNGQPLVYNRSGTLEQGKFIAVGDKSVNWSKLLSR